DTKMNLRTMTASAAMLTLLMACSQAPDTGASSAADATSAADTALPALPRTPAPDGARVFIVSPEDGATVSSPVHVVFGVEGMEVGPAGQQNDNAGHHHLLVNTDLADASMPIPADAQHIHYGQGQTE